MNPNKRNKYNKMYDKTSESVDPKELNPVPSKPTDDTSNETKPVEVQDAPTTPTAEKMQRGLRTDESTDESTKVEGIVTAAKLNVRKKPSKNAPVETVITENTRVRIDTARSTGEWYYVTTTAGVEGYCMKDFITTDAV